MSRVEVVTEEQVVDGLRRDVESYMLSWDAFVARLHDKGQRVLAADLRGMNLWALADHLDSALFLLGDDWREALR